MNTARLYGKDNIVSKRKVDIIWNLTLICPWDCQICCVDAVHVKKSKGLITVSSEALSRQEQIVHAPDKGSIYDQAAAHRQAEGLELDFNQKMQVLENLEGYDVKIDFSGGDVLTVSENLNVLKIASKKFGKDKITLTATGAGLSKLDVNELANYIGEMNFTYDGTDFECTPNRPNGYAVGNLKKAAQFRAAGVKTRAECPLTMQNIQDDVLREIYLNLHKRHIDKILVMRLFPVGRGATHGAEIPSPDQYRKAIALLKNLEREFGYPQLKLQCAMKHFDNSNLETNPCDLFEESFGLTPDGTLLTSPWAINKHGRPLDDAWVLGNLEKNTLSEILNSEKAQVYLEHKDDNFGHCKIFSYFNSAKPDPIDRIFDVTDPLYSQKEQEVL